MAAKWKLALAVGAMLLMVPAVTEAQANHPTFTPKDREQIEAYYTHLIGTLAPGSVDRTPLALGVEKALVIGSHVPMQFEKDLQPLPEKLETQLTQVTGDYARYKLGRHVVLVHKGDLEITDILKNVAVK